MSGYFHYGTSDLKVQTSFYRNNFDLDWRLLRALHSIEELNPLNMS